MSETLLFRITEPVLSMEVDDLELSERAKHCMKRGGFHTVEDIIDNQNKLATIKSCGGKTIREVKNKILELMIEERTKEM